MKTRGKIDIRELNRLLRQGLTQAEAAKHFNVSRSAVCQAVKQLKQHVPKVTALEKAASVVDDNLDAMAQLRRINSAILEQLRQAEQDAKELDGKDKRATQAVIVKLAAEVRKQLQLQLNILELWHDLKQVGAFQQAVLDALESCDPSLRRKVIERLKQGQVLRQTVKL